MSRTTKPKPTSYEKMLAVGQERLAAAMRDAAERNRLTRGCNGTEDCASVHHLVCCLSPWGRRQRR